MTLLYLSGSFQKLRFLRDPIEHILESTCIEFLIENSILIGICVMGVFKRILPIMDPIVLLFFHSRIIQVHDIVYFNVLQIDKFLVQIIL